MKSKQLRSLSQNIIESIITTNTATPISAFYWSRDRLVVISVSVLSMILPIVKKQ